MEDKVIEGYRLSPQQERIWLLQKEHAGEPYRAQSKILIEGELNVAVLTSAIEAIVSRHEILRTTFQHLPSMTMALQVISQSTPFLLREHDLSTLDAEGQAAKLETLTQEAWWSASDSESASSLHAAIAKLSATSNVLLIDLTALCADSRTLENLMREIIRCYEACVKGSPLVSETMQYADLAEWQNELRSSEDTEIGRSYWRGLAIPEFLDLRLPFEAEQTLSSSFEPRVLQLQIPLETVARIETL